VRKVHLLDLEPVLAAQIGKELDRPGGLVPEAPPPADRHVARAEPVDEHVGHELLRGPLRHLFREREDRHEVDSRLPQQLNLSFRRREQRGHPIRLEHHAGMPVPRNDPGLDAQLARVRRGACYQRAVPEVDAVEGPDRQRGAIRWCGERLDAY
jgi:hypothetical protein